MNLLTAFITAPVHQFKRTTWCSILFFAALMIFKPGWAVLAALASLILGMIVMAIAEPVKNIVGEAIAHVFSKGKGLAGTVVGSATAEGVMLLSGFMWAACGLVWSFFTVVNWSFR